MRYILIISTMLVLSACGGDILPSQSGTVQKVQIPKLNNVSEAIAFLRSHPAIRTTGIPLWRIADELDINRSLLGVYVNADSQLETDQLQAAMKIRKVIFAAGANPRQQLDDYLNSLDEDMFKVGVSFEQVEKNVKYKQEAWTSAQMRFSISHYLDKEKYVAHRLGRDMYIFYKGSEPPQQVDNYLASLDQKTFEQGVPIAQVADNVTYTPSRWSMRNSHRSIGKHIDKDKYVLYNIWSNEEREKRIYRRDASPTVQITNYLASLDLEVVAQGVLISQIADNVNYTHNLARTASSRSIRTHLDKEKYLIRRLTYKGQKQSFVFHKTVLSNSKRTASEPFKAGVPINTVANLPATDEELDKLGYATELLGVGMKYEKYLFAKDYLPRRQISTYLASLPPAQLKRGVSVARVADNIERYGRKDWSDEEFHKSIVIHLDKDTYASDFLFVDDKVETYIFAKGFTSHEQILNYLQSVDPTILQEQGISLQQVADNVSYRQPGVPDFMFLIEITWFIDGRHGYVVRYQEIDDDTQELRILLK